MISREGIPGLGLRGRLDLEYYPALLFIFNSALGFDLYFLGLNLLRLRDG